MRLIDKIIPKLNLSDSYFELPEVPQGQAIPKIIHHTFYTSQLPTELENNAVALRKSNPGWEYRFYDEADRENFIASNFPARVFQIFKQIDDVYGAAKADLFRYLLLYKCGGVYLDIKSAVTRPFDDVLKPDDQYLLSHWRNQKGEEFQGWGKHDELRESKNGEFLQWYIACAPGHPFLKAVIESVLTNIERYNPALHGVGKLGVLRVTGPIAYTLAINRLLSKHKHRLVDAKVDLGLEYTVYKGLYDHMALFASHYSWQTKSIVKLGFTRKQLARLIYGMQRFSRMASNMGTSDNR